MSHSKRLIFITAIELDRKNEHREYHIHKLQKLRPIQTRFTDQEVEREVRKLPSSLDEVNYKVQGW